MKRSTVYRLVVLEWDAEVQKECRTSPLGRVSWPCCWNRTGRDGVEDDDGDDEEGQEGDTPVNYVVVIVKLLS